MNISQIIWTLNNVSGYYRNLQIYQHLFIKKDMNLLIKYAILGKKQLC